jgi:hypothetical protein
MHVLNLSLQMCKKLTKLLCGILIYQAHLSGPCALLTVNAKTKYTVHSTVEETGRGA